MTRRGYHLFGVWEHTRVARRQMERLTAEARAAGCQPDAWPRKYYDSVRRRRDAIFERERNRKRMIHADFRQVYGDDV